MPLNKLSLDNALAVFVDGNPTLARQGKFVDLCGCIYLEHAAMLNVGNQQETRRLEPVSNLLNYIRQDLWVIETLFERLDWLRGMWIEGQLDDAVWYRYATSDIASFHVVIRSLFDYAAMVVVLISGKAGQLPVKTKSQGKQCSFRDLREWVLVNSSRLGNTALVKVIADCDWFEDLRNVRDAMVHGSGQTLVFFVKPRILFQVIAKHKGSDKFLMKMSELMYNENVMDFELYAGMMHGYLLDFLEQLAMHVFSWIGPVYENCKGRSRHTHPGLAIGKRWIEAARAIGNNVCK